MTKRSILLFASGFLACVGLIACVGLLSDGSQAEAKASPVKALAEREGVYAESTSAAAFAGLEQLVKNGAIGQGDSVLVPVTGSGLKEPI